MDTEGCVWWVVFVLALLATLVGLPFVAAYEAHLFMFFYNWIG